MKVSFGNTFFFFIYIYVRIGVVLSMLGPNRFFFLKYWCLIPVHAYLDTCIGYDSSDQLKKKKSKINLDKCIRL